MLVGRNVSLRPVAVSDAEMIAEWFGDPTYLGDYFNIWPSTPGEWERTAEQKTTPRSGVFVIVHRESGEPSGNIGYFCPYTLTEMYQGLELWWVVHPRFRRRGIARQAACLLVNHLFDATPTHRLQALIVAGNEGSCRVAEAAGMQREGLCRGVFFLHGHYADMHQYTIVRDDWRDEPAYRGARPPF